MSSLAFRSRELAYTQLNTEEGEIRLLIVEPARSRDNAIICRLKVSLARVCSLLDAILMAADMNSQGLLASFG
jgi:hypothetical protein